MRSGAAVTLAAEIGLSMFAFIVERVKRLGFLFGLTVFVPVILAIIYYGIFASNIYLSESQFIVRSPEKQAPSGLGVFLQSSGIGSSNEELSAAQSYIVSRDALRALNKNHAITEAFTRSEISAVDRLDPMGSDASFEGLYTYFKNHVEVEHESASAITKMTVRAYTPQDAFRINQHLLDLSEQLVNRLNRRARNDLIRFAQRDADEAEQKAAQASLALSEYRNRYGVVDPEKQAQVQLQLISKMQDQLIVTKMQRSELKAYTPQNPQIEVLNTRVAELAEQIDIELGKVAGNRKSLSSVAAQYQRLQLENQFAERQLTAIMASLVDAKNEARRKQVYVERIVEPNLPDKALEPRRLRGILAVLILGLVAWGIVSLLVASVREHNG